MSKATDNKEHQHDNRKKSFEPLPDKKLGEIAGGSRKKPRNRHN